MAERQRPARRAVRVVCLDQDHRVFLLRWRDPADPANTMWEPPGGGVEPGEDDRTAAIREVLEETGLTVAPVSGRQVVVHRDVWWNGRRHVGAEPFLLAVVDPAAPVLPLALNELERDTLLDSRWLSWPEIVALDDPVQPPEFGEVLRALHPDGPWAHSTGR